MGQLRDQLPEVQAMEGHIDYMGEEALEEERELAKKSDILELAKHIHELSQKHGIWIIASCWPELNTTWVTYGTGEKQEIVWYQPEKPEKGEK